MARGQLLKNGQNGQNSMSHSHSSYVSGSLAGINRQKDRAAGVRARPRLDAVGGLHFSPTDDVGGDRDALFRNGRFVRGGRGRVPRDLLADRWFRHPGSAFCDGEGGGGR